MGGITGAGSAQTMAVDPFNANGVAVGGDSWGCYTSPVAGNQWFAATKELGDNGDIDVAQGQFNFIGMAYSRQYTGANQRIYCLTGKLQDMGDQTGGFGYIQGNSYVQVSTAVRGGETVPSGGLRADKPRPVGQRLVVDYDASSGIEYIYVGTGAGHGVARSTDAGADWTVLGLIGEPTAICAMVLDPNDPTKLYVGTHSDQAYLLSNVRSGTVTVTHLTNAPAQVQSLAVIGGNLYAACGTDGIFQVTRSGTTTTWTSLGGTLFTGSGSTWSAIGGSGSTIYVGCVNPDGQHSIAKSVDAGANWSWVTDYELDGSGNVSITEWGTSRQWWQAVWDPTRSVPGGGGSDFTQVIEVDAFNANIVYLCGKAGMWKSEDGGSTWRPAMNGLGANMHDYVVADTVSGSAKAWVDDVDFKGESTTDNWQTGAEDSTPPSHTPGYSITKGGHTYAVNINVVPRDVTVDGVSIADEFFKATAVRPSDIDVSPDGNHIYISQLGGGILIADKTPIVPPNPPTAVVATPGNAEVTLAWTASSGLTGYNVYRSTTNGGSYSKLNSSAVTATSYTDATAINGTTYYYVVTAFNTPGESVHSNQSIAEPVAPAPSAPTGLTASPGDHQVSLTWATTSGATSYNVYRSTTSGGPYSKVTPSGVPMPSFTNTGLTDGTTYYYVVTAVNSGGESGDSSQVSATPTAVTAPAAPTGLTATAGNAQVALNWSISTGASSYKLYRSTVSGGPYSNIASSLSAPGYTDTGLTNGTTYYYVATAVNAGGESGYSSQAAGTPSGSTTAGEFTAEDIGSPAIAGSTSFNSGTGVYTVAGAGVDIYGTSDQFQFAHEPNSDASLLVARVTQVQNTQAWAKGALMIRDGLAANAANVTLALTASNGVQLLHRPTAGGTEASDAVSPGFSAPYWIRLERNGNIFTGYESPDGASWFVTGSVTLAMNAATQVGLAVTSHNSAALNTSIFDNVTVTEPPVWTSVDVGSTGAAGSSSLNNSTGVFTVKGAGANIYGTTDAFQFYYQTIPGDGTFVAQVTGVQNTNQYAKAGIMIRHSLAANAANAVVDITPSNGAEFNRRLTDGGTTAQTLGSGAAAYWVKLVRSGDNVSAYTSPDGGTWTQLGPTITLPLGTGGAFVGLVANSHVAGTLCTTTYENVWFGAPSP